MNAQSGLMVVLGLGALAGIGYAVASSTKDTTPPAGPPLPEPSPVGPLPSYVSQALIDAYEQCYQFGCTQAEYDNIRFRLQELVRAHPEETDLWVFFQDELSKQQVAHNAGVTTYADYNTQSAGLGLDFTDPQVNPGTQPAFLDLGALGGATGVPLPLPLNFPATLAVSYVNCWYQLCPQTEFDTLIAGMIAYMNRTDISDASRAQVSLAMKSAFNRRQAVWLGTQGTSRVQGRHTGGCACQARQEEVGTGACCDSCAEGKECEECGNHAPAVG